MNIDDKEVLEFIERAFNQNLESIYSEGGHSLTADLVQLARNQVIHYYLKLKDIAQNVTETEVKLNLPFQKTERGRIFGIEGVVDIVREDEKVVMYDIKTHDADIVRCNREQYEDQLNVYAHIWKNLRNQDLDECAIIATELPSMLKEALSSGNRQEIEYAISKWDPLVEIPIQEGTVEETIQRFAESVDMIEDRVFSPAPVSKLQEIIPGTSSTFGVRVCRNCDARFSCSSFRAYAESARGAKTGMVKKYFIDPAPELDQYDWLENNLEAQQFELNPDDLV